MLFYMFFMELNSFFHLNIRYYTLNTPSGIYDAAYPTSILIWTLCEIQEKIIGA